MTKKEQLYYLLDAYKKKQYDIPTFCRIFEDIFYPDIPKDELTAFELIQFEALGDIVARFSPFEEDLKTYPKVYHTEADVINAIKTADSTLVLKSNAQE